MSISPSHSIVLESPASFLHRLMIELGTDASMSLEGDLRRCRFPEAVIVSRSACPPLVRDTLWPKQDFVILRLTPDSVEPIFGQIMAAGLERAILHVKIQRGGLLQFSAADNFGYGCWTGPNVRAEFLEQLVKEGLVCSFEPCPG